MPRRIAALLVSVLVVVPGAGRPSQDDAGTVGWQLVVRLIEARGFEQPFGVALEHMKGVPVSSWAAHKLARVTRGLSEPWTVPALARELRDLLAGPVREGRGRDLTRLAPGVADWLDLEAFRSPSGAGEDLGLAALDDQWKALMRDDLGGVELLEGLSAYLATAHAVLAEGVGAMDPEARALLFDRHLDFCESWYRTHFPEDRPDQQPSQEQSALSERVIERLLVADPTDRARTLAVAEALARLASPDFLSGLRGRLGEVEARVGPAAGFEGDVLVVVGSDPSERVVLGGPRPTRYLAPAALVIDLGGNDTYARAAVVDSADLLASVVLDLRGDDVYESQTPGPAYSAGGIALLVDASGDDTYRSKRLGQAASALGFALLADLGGNDQYEMEDYGQGHALCGVGLLYDFAGDDSYSAWAFAQGAELGYGFAALVDGDGKDRYLADLHWPDVYGNSGPESYHGASQGYASGLRYRVAGGIGALLDLGDGNDMYRSGNFSQGGGYYQSFGLMYDDGGDDANQGYRYSQGFGVHQAIGMRWDAGGDDRYTCRSVAHAGMAWDEGVGWFLDEQGDDQYHVGGLGLGSAAQTGVAVFVEGGGEDVYVGESQTQGATGGSEYHGKPSLGVLIDLGGEKDRYSAEGRGNDVLRVDEGVGVFLDTRAATLEKALRAKLPDE